VHPLPAPVVRPVVQYKNRAAARDCLCQLLWVVPRDRVFPVRPYQGFHTSIGVPYFHQGPILPLGSLAICLALAAAEGGGPELRVPTSARSSVGLRAPGGLGASCTLLDRCKSTGPPYLKLRPHIPYTQNLSAT